MFKYLTNGLQAGITIMLIEKYRHLSTKLLKIEAVKYYLEAVQMARGSAIFLMQMKLVINLMSVGALIFHAGLFILLPWSVEAKATLCIIMGLVYVSIGWVALHALMNEKSWMKNSNVAEMMKEVIGQSNKDGGIPKINNTT
ncbi:MAG: hypothetical protein HQK77_05370 [Desulfobacterales bacterium]|nr:hypothetical protein [Desulfobacterales bacterium]